MSDDNHGGGNKVAGDIEEADYHPLSTSVDATTTNMNASNSDVEAGSSSSPASLSRFAITLILIFVAILFPLIGVYNIVSYILFGEPKTPGQCFRPKTNQPSRGGGFFSNLPQTRYSSPTIKRRYMISTITCRVGCLFLLLLVLTLHLSSLKSVTLFGLVLWKWSLLFVLVFFSHAFFLNTFGSFGLMFALLVVTEAHRGFYFTMGLLDSLVSLINVGFLFLVWMLYFHQKLQGEFGTRVDKYTTMTLGSVLVGAVMWVLKTVVLLRWKANAIYTRFRRRILMAAFRLFFLNLVLDSNKMHHLLPWRYKEVKVGEWELVQREEEVASTRTSIAFAHGFNRRTLEARIISSRLVSFEQMNVLAQSLTSLAKEPIRDDIDTQISHILSVYYQNIGPEKYVTEEKIRQLVKGDMDDAQLLLEELQAEYPSKQIHQVPFQKWVVTVTFDF